jgi:hypothetical protein
LQQIAQPASNPNPTLTPKRIVPNCLLVVVVYRGFSPTTTIEKSVFAAHTGTYYGSKKALREGDLYCLLIGQ